MVSPGPAPEAIPELVLELVHGAALSAARGVAPEPVHALSVDLAPSPVHDSGREVAREVEKEVDPVSLVLPEVQKASLVAEVSLSLLDLPESSFLGAISKRISYIRN